MAVKFNSMLPRWKQVVDIILSVRPLALNSVYAPAVYLIVDFTSSVPGHFGYDIGAEQDAQQTQ